MPRKRILLVDDSRTVLLAETMMLARGDFDVLTAADGEEGVAKARAFLPDLILMDVMMPRMDGFEACRVLRADAATRRIPVVLVTTRGEASNVEKGYASGAKEYIAKPFDGVELLAKVKSCLSA